MIICIYFIVISFSKSGVYERYGGHSGPVTGINFHPSTGMCINICCFHVQPAHSHFIGAIDFSDWFITSSTDWSVKLWNSKVRRSFNISMLFDSLFTLHSFFFSR